MSDTTEHKSEQEILEELYAELERFSPDKRLLAHAGFLCFFLFVF